MDSDMYTDNHTIDKCLMKLPIAYLILGKIAGMCIFTSDEPKNIVEVGKGFNRSHYYKTIQRLVDEGYLRYENKHAIVLTDKGYHVGKIISRIH